MAILGKYWERHANPWSGATRIATYPFLLLSIWYHNWYAVAAVIAWVIINPLVFPKPRKFDSWLSKGVMGEKRWTEHWRWDFNLLLNFMNALCFIPSLYAAYMTLFWPMLCFGALSFVFKLWFVDRMAVYYERKKGREF